VLRTVCHAKIHRATVTDADLNYVGSLTVDEALLKEADILPYEKVQVVNVTNGARFETYIMPGGPGEVIVNGAAARLAQPGDIVIIMAYVQLEDAEARRHQIRVVHVDSENKPVEASAVSGRPT